MFRYIFVILLINESYRSLGSPVDMSALLVHSMSTRAKNCEDAFLSESILNQTASCIELKSKPERPLQCMLFYDMSTQLCNAVGSSQLRVSPNNTFKSNDEENVDALCAAATDWLFSNLTEFPRYKLAVDQVFKNTVTCSKICNVEDVLSVDSNYYCKFYKWGTELLKSQTKIQENLNSKVPKTQVPSIEKLEPASNNDDVEIKPSSAGAPHMHTSTNKEVHPEAPKQEEAGSPPISGPSETDTKVEIAVPESKPDVQNDVKVEDTGDLPNIAQSGNDQPGKISDASPKVDTVQDSAVKPEAALNTDIKSDVDKELQKLNNELEHKDAVLENPKVKQSAKDKIDYYQESDKDGLSDIQGDDDDESMIGEVDIKQDSPKVPENINIVASAPVEKEYYPNPIDDRFPEEDDHFFSFFLTAIVMVVLLYVLYHNKSKLSKVFFGLVLEGRQNGRRRDSRGHAYRRLDTLEQAMNANSAAPPSKIIY